jgi:hypothetical protein
MRYPSDKRLGEPHTPSGCYEYRKMYYPCWESFSGHQARSLLPYQLSYPGSQAIRWTNAKSYSFTEQFGGPSDVGAAESVYHWIRLCVILILSVHASVFVSVSPFCMDAISLDFTKTSEPFDFLQSDGSNGKKFEKKWLWPYRSTNSAGTEIQTWIPLSRWPLYRLGFEPSASRR